MSEDMAFAEGCYRLEGGEWQVVTAYKTGDCHPVGIRTGVRWESGATGINIVLPDNLAINAQVLMAVMSSTLGVTRWREVIGPDSMALR